MKVNQIIYLKAVNEMLETAKYKLLSSLEELGWQVGETTPDLSFRIAIHTCPIDDLSKLKGTCYVAAYGLRNGIHNVHLVNGSPIHHITLENPSNYKEDEIRLREKLANDE